MIRSVHDITVPVQYTCCSKALCIPMLLREDSNPQRKKHHAEEEVCTCRPPSQREKQIPNDNKQVCLPFLPVHPSLLRGVLLVRNVYDFAVLLLTLPSSTGERRFLN
jgi:hypothetical protein